MALNFPDSPSLNDTFTYSDKVWVWDGTAWNLVGTVSGHGALTGLGDDDHPQYLLTDGSRNVSSLNVTGDLIVGGTLPTQSVNAQTGTVYTFVLSDAQKLVTFTNSSSISAIVPPNSSVPFPVGTRIDIAQRGIGVLTVSEGSGVFVNVHGGDTLVLDGQYSYASVIKVGTDTWDLIGRLVPA